MCILCDNNQISGISRLNSNNCSVLTNIPNIEGLQFLQCKNCPLLTNISNIRGLQTINCVSSALLTSIPPIESLGTLLCDNCPNLVSIPYFKDLQVLSCNNCPKLMYIPIIEDNDDYDNILLFKPFNIKNNGDECKYLISKSMQRLYNNIYNLWKKYKLYKFISHLEVKYYSNPTLPYMKHYIENELYDDNNNEYNNNILSNMPQSTLKIGFINKKNNLIWYNLKSNNKRNM